MLKWDKLAVRNRLASRQFSFYSLTQPTFQQSPFYPFFCHRFSLSQTCHQLTLHTATFRYHIDVNCKNQYRTGLVFTRRFIQLKLYHPIFCTEEIWPCATFLLGSWAGDLDERWQCLNPEKTPSLISLAALFTLHRSPFLDQRKWELNSEQSRIIPWCHYPVHLL